MTRAPFRVTYDAAGTPGVWADDVAGAYRGCGYVQALHRPLQTLLLSAAGRGVLGKTLWAHPGLLELDWTVHRFDLAGTARLEAGRLEPEVGGWVDAYLAGVGDGLRRRGKPGPLRLLAASLPPPDRESLLGAFLLGAYLGQAQGQERMERALVDVVRAGADCGVLEAMFAPHLRGWRPEQLRRLGPAFAAAGAARPSGSNAWAVNGGRSATGTPWLCGDPHLQVNQLPSAFTEVRARVGDDFWLGAAVPGLPGLAIGRNRHLAWSGTFAVADMVDLTLEEATATSPGRVVEVGRRGQKAWRAEVHVTERGVRDAGFAPVLATAWSGLAGAAAAFAALLRLPQARSADEGERLLGEVGTLSLHFVLADRAGDVRRCTTGRIPARSAGWSGLYPVTAAEAGWGSPGVASYGHRGADDGVVASANEAAAGAPAPFAQPGYRHDRIGELLRAQRRHDRDSLQRLQLDVVSLQGRRLGAALAARLPPGGGKAALTAWDAAYDPDSRGAHAFELAYGAARAALAPWLGGDCFRELLATSELSVWWCARLDELLAAALGLPSAVAALPQLDAMRAAVAAAVGAVRAAPSPWGEVQRLRLPHVVLGRAPGVGRGPFALPGSLATVCQGNLVRAGGVELAVAPAYRFVTDLGDDTASTALPGGIDDSPTNPSYDAWLDDWRAGRYHTLRPPQAGEREAP